MAADRPDVVYRREVPVVCVRSEHGRAGLASAFERLDRALGGLRGRRRYVWFVRGVCLACVAARTRDAAAAHGLHDGVLPGGPYARARHWGAVARAPETFATLERVHDLDPKRFPIEEHLIGGEVFVLIPVRS